jgi:hypothetical protein
MQYIRLYTDDAGDSRFEDVVLAGEPQNVVESSLRALLSDPIPATQVYLRTVVQEASSTEPHNAPRRQFIVQLSGVSEVETSTGEVRRCGPGTIMLLEDTHGKGHVTRGVSDGERRTLVIVLPEDPSSWTPERADTTNSADGVSR